MGGTRRSGVGDDGFTPKRERGHGVEIMEVVWKVCAAVANFQLKRSVNLHDALHGFRAGRGTGTFYLEANLAHQLTASHSIRSYRCSWMYGSRTIPWIKVGAWRF